MYNISLVGTELKDTHDANLVHKMCTTIVFSLRMHCKPLVTVDAAALLEQ